MSPKEDNGEIEFDEEKNFHFVVWETNWNMEMYFIPIFNKYLIGEKKDLLLKFMDTNCRKGTYR